MMRWLTASAFSAALAAVALASAGSLHAQARQAAPASKLRFDVSFIPQVHDGPITGRVFVMVTRTVDKVPEPRLQIGRTGVPFFGRDVERLQPEQIVSIDGTDLGTPLDSINDIPAGDYFVQAVVVVYSEFHRADGHVVWMHDDQWEGQRWNRSPGNALQRGREGPHRSERRRRRSSWSPTQKRAADRGAARHEVRQAHQVPEPDADEVLGPADLSRRGRAAAARLRPRDDQLSRQLRPGPFLDSRRRTASTRQNEFSKAWLSDGFPRMIAVTFQHPTPYFDDSYAVNSVNNGPYGDAIMQELIPEVEKRFRVIREPYARILSGGSTGGWEAAALQIFHPDFFGGAWSLLPRLGHVHGRRGHQHLRGRERVLQDLRLAQGADGEQPDGQRPAGDDLAAAQLLRAGQRHARPIGRADRHLVGGVRADRQGRLLRAAVRQADRRHQQAGRQRTGRSTTTCSTTCRRTGRRSARSSSTSCTSTPATSTPTT